MGDQQHSYPFLCIAAGRNWFILQAQAAAGQLARMPLSKSARYLTAALVLICLWSAPYAKPGSKRGGGPLKRHFQSHTEKAFSHVVQGFDLVSPGW